MLHGLEVEAFPKIIRSNGVELFLVFPLYGGVAFRGWDNEVKGQAFRGAQYEHECAGGFFLFAVEPQHLGLCFIAPQGYETVPWKVGGLAVPLLVGQVQLEELVFLEGGALGCASGIHSNDQQQRKQARLHGLTMVGMKMNGCLNGTLKSEGCHLDNDSCIMSLMEKNPFLPVSHSAALTAPKAKPSLEKASWRIWMASTLD